MSETEKRPLNECSHCGSPVGHNAGCIISIRERNDLIATLESQLMVTRSLLKDAAMQVTEKEAEVTRLRERAAGILTNVAQILDVVKGEWGEEWSVWDQEQRDAISEFLMGPEQYAEYRAALAASAPLASDEEFPCPVCGNEVRHPRTGMLNCECPAPKVAQPEAQRETKEEYETRMLAPDLCLRGKATDHIWAMEDVDGYIGLRMDCGDAGTVYLTPKQAQMAIDDLTAALAQASSEIPIGAVIPNWGEVVKAGRAYWVADSNRLAYAVDAGMLEALYAEQAGTTQADGSGK